MSRSRRERQPVPRSGLGSAKISSASCGSSIWSLRVSFEAVAAQRIAASAARARLTSIESSERFLGCKPIAMGRWIVPSRTGHLAKTIRTIRTERRVRRSRRCNTVSDAARRSDFDRLTGFLAIGALCSVARGNFWSPQNHQYCAWASGSRLSPNRLGHPVARLLGCGHDLGGTAEISLQVVADDPRHHAAVYKGAEARKVAGAAPSRSLGCHRSVATNPIGDWPKMAPDTLTR
jgi:hypothetical protein